MKMRTPGASSASSRKRAMSRLRSRSSKRLRIRSRSAASCSRRFARPRTISRGSEASASHEARPVSTSWAASVSRSCRARARCSTMSRRSSASVCPSPRADRKLPASRSELGVWPGGGVNRRFSTRPSAKTRITRARPGARLTNSICLSGASSCRGISTTEAPRVRVDSAVDTRSSMAAVSAGMSPMISAMRTRSSGPMGPTSINPSTKRRRPSWVGKRPAETCGLSSRPMCSRSCMTLRMVAAETGMLRVSVREPTGSPVSR